MKEITNIKVYFPENFNVFFNLFNKDFKNYVIYNELDFQKNPEFLGKRVSIANFFIINKLEKLNTVSLKGNFLEIGPCVTYNEILQIGKNNIPSLFYEFISKINDKIYLNSINLANGFYYKNTVFDVYPLLLSLDAQIEFKNVLTRKTYTINACNINRIDSIANRNVMFITKFKFPMTNLWNKNFYNKVFFNTPPSFSILDEMDIISICILLNTRKSVINDFVLQMFYDDKFIILRDFQILLLNKSLPLSFSEIKNSLKIIEKSVRDMKNFKIEEKNLKLIKIFCLDVLMNF